MQGTKYMIIYRNKIAYVILYYTAIPAVIIQGSAGVVHLCGIVLFYFLKTCDYHIHLYNIFICESSFLHYFKKIVPKSHFYIILKRVDKCGN